MKKLFTLAIATLLLTGCAGASDTNSERGVISVQAEETEELNPTTVKVSFAIETNAQDAQKASDLNKQLSEKAINAVKALVDTQKGEIIKTTSFNLNPKYNYKDGTAKLEGYKASNTLQVTIKDNSKIGKIISTALANGANSVNNLQFLLEDTENNCNILLQKAAANAKKKADKIANSAGTSVVGVKYLGTSCSSNQSSYMNYRLMNAQMAKGYSYDSAAEEMPIEAGKGQLRASVSAEFYVK